VREKSVTVPGVSAGDKQNAGAVRKQPAAVQRAADGSVVIAGVRLTHPDRVIYPDQGITKLDLAQYSVAVADWALPHLAHRPLSLVRCPEGQGEACFYRKHVGAEVPAALKRIEIPEKSGSEVYLMVGNPAGRVALVQIGVLEIHPWGSTADRLETPDRITFDLDPDIGLPWSQVIAAGLETRDVLAGPGLRSFAKTTGGKGLQVIVPVVRRLEWEKVKAFTRAVAMRMAKQSPERYTATQSKRARHGRIYIDYLRNARARRRSVPIPPHARPDAPVSTPLLWEEVERAVRPEDFTVARVPDRLAALKPDPWVEIGAIRQSIIAAAQRQVGR
jgi:bifunctional non-homologous end joining protein LigD